MIWQARSDTLHSRSSDPDAPVGVHSASNVGRLAIAEDVRIDGVLGGAGEVQPMRRCVLSPRNLTRLAGGTDDGPRPIKAVD